MKYTVLFNPLAGHDGGNTVMGRLKLLLPDDELEFADLTQIADVQSHINGLAPDVNIIIAGGDGTLNRFVNAVDCDGISHPVYLFAAGSGNDFFNDLRDNMSELLPEAAIADNAEQSGALLHINNYIINLPTVTVKGKTYKFINGIGFGIDGYCCEVGDKLKAEGKKVNYTGIAIKGLLFHFKPKNATVTVDGVTTEFKKVWVAPAMNGRYYGGGMIPTPAQSRKTREKLSACLFYGKGRIATLIAFPSIFKGEHIKKTKMVKILEGREITVRFDAPCALQIDGETILDVTEYTARI